MAKHWVIGDIHGCLKTFQRMVEDRLRITAEDTLYLLGDYVSKGPDSKGVIDYIWQLQKEQYQVVTLQGNHEEMLLNARTDSLTEARLMQKGGEDIVRSFGVQRLKDVPSPYLDWIESLKQYIILDKYVLVHAGLNFAIPNPYTDTQAMRWIRGFQVKPEMIGFRTLIHGHSPIDYPITQEQLATEPLTVINLDTGCVYAEREKQGRLAALELESRQLVLQPNIDLEMENA